jgi:HK97 family phage major capsid protein
MASQNEKMLKAVETELGRHAAEIEDLLGKAEKEERESTPEEREDMDKHLKAMRELKARRSDIEESIQTEREVKETALKFGKSDPTEVQAQVKPGGDRVDRLVKSIGEQFVESAGYQRIKSADNRGQSFTTGAVEMMFDTKGTLLEGAGGGGGALANLVPSVIPGVVDKLFQRLTVADLLLQGQTTSPQLIYAVEGTATSGAAGVAEAGTKPESTLGLTSTTENVKKIATVLNVSDEMLEDAAQVQSYINGRLSLFIQIEEERQLLRGAGTNELQGIMNGRGINVYAGGTAVGNRAVQLFTAMNGQRGSALLEPDWIVINPSDWQTIRLSTDSAGQYFGGGPFQGPYGNGRNFDASNIVNGADEFLWNKPVIVTSALGSGTALIGTRAGAQVFRKSGISVEATNSHASNFTSDLVTIRAEERLGLAVYRPSSFTDVRLS